MIFLSFYFNYPLHFSQIFLFSISIQYFFPFFSFNSSLFNQFKPFPPFCLFFFSILLMCLPFSLHHHHHHHLFHFSSSSNNCLFFYPLYHFKSLPLLKSHFSSLLAQVSPVSIKCLLLIISINLICYNDHKQENIIKVNKNKIGKGKISNEG